MTHHAINHLSTSFEWHTSTWNTQLQQYCLQRKEANTLASPPLVHCNHWHWQNRTHRFNSDWLYWFHKKQKQKTTLHQPFTWVSSDRIGNQGKVETSLTCKVFFLDRQPQVLSIDSDARIGVHEAHSVIMVTRLYERMSATHTMGHRLVLRDSQDRNSWSP